MSTPERDTRLTYWSNTQYESFIEQLESRIATVEQRLAETRRVTGIGHWMLGDDTQTFKAVPDPRVTFVASGNEVVAPIHVVDPTPPSAVFPVTPVVATNRTAHPIADTNHPEDRVQVGQKLTLEQHPPGRTGFDNAPKTASPVQLADENPLVAENAHLRKMNRELQRQLAALAKPPRTP